MIRSIHLCVALTLVLSTVGRVWGGPPTRAEAEQRAKVTANLKAALKIETTSSGKAEALSRAYNADPNPDVRRVVFEFIPTQAGKPVDRFLINALTGDPDAGIRSLAAKSLGAHGTAECLPDLARAAAADRVTDLRIDCIAGTGTARRAATFAIADLAARYPALAGKAAAALRELTPARGPNDHDSLADARIQALYQVTRDERLLSPFLDRLRSKDAKVRESTVVAFQYFKLNTAPRELVNALGDADAGVRSWAAMALGAIGDPKTAPALMAAARDPNQDAGLRCNAIYALGRMNAAAATGLMRTLLTDEKTAVQAQAAIALYRLTGEKVKQFPAGYRTD